MKQTWIAQDRRGLPRTRYYWYAERHPRYRPWPKRRLGWKHRAHEVMAVPIRPWPAWWYPEALCVHSHEGAWNDDTGNGFYGGMQFDEGTWLSNGGGAYAARADLASPYDQLVVAYHTWQARGWQPWPNTSRMCGL